MGGGTFWYEESLILPVFGAHAVVPRNRGEDPESFIDALHTSKYNFYYNNYYYFYYYYYYHL